MNIAVYCGSSPGHNDHFAQAARDLGIWIASHGHALVYGGSSVGLMGILSSNVLAAGGDAYGVEPQFFIDAGVAQHDLTELFVVDTMSERKAKMIELADAFVALPGGVGTLEEISEIMSCVRLGLDVSECFFLNIDGFYNPLIELLHGMEQQGFIDRDDLERFHFLESIEQLACCLDRAERSPLAARATAAELAEQRAEVSRESQVELEAERAAFYAPLQPGWADASEAEPQQ